MHVCRCKELRKNMVWCDCIWMCANVGSWGRHGVAWLQMHVCRLRELRKNMAWYDYIYMCADGVAAEEEYSLLWLSMHSPSVSTWCEWVHAALLWDHGVDEYTQPAVRSWCEWVHIALLWDHGVNEHTQPFSKNMVWISTHNPAVRSYKALVCR